MLGRTMAAAIAAVTITAAAPGGASALGRAGDLDPTFNGGRPAELQLAQAGGHATYLYGLAADLQGRPVFGGATADGPDAELSYVARLTADGRPDPSFGAGGSRLAQYSLDGDPTRRTSAVYGVATLGDGRVVASITGSGRRDMAALELLADGSPDLDVGAAGLMSQQPFGPTTAVAAEAVLAEPDGTVYAGGSSYPTPQGMVVTKFSPTGQPVAGFGTGGTASLTPADQSTIVAMARQPDGRLITVGTARTSPTTLGALVARVLPSTGALDPSFGTAPGFTLVQAADAGGKQSRATGVAVAPDGSIWVSGTADDAEGRAAVLIMHLLADGRPDPAFGSAGIKRVQLTLGRDPNPAVAHSNGDGIAVQPDGKVVVSATSYDTGTIGTTAVVRVLPDGRLDPTFGDAGVVRLQLAGTGGDEQFTLAHGLALSGDGLLVAGTADDRTQRAFVARLLLAPLPDPPAPGGGNSPGGAPTGPSPISRPPGSGRGVARLAASSLRADAAGRVRVTLRCSSAGPCAGRLALVAATGRVAFGAAAHRAAVYATKSYKITAGGRSVVTLRLSTSARRLLRRHHRVRARLALAPSGGRTVTRQRVTLALR